MKPARVLIVEDDESLKATLVGVIRAVDPEALVEWRTSAESALQILREPCPPGEDPRYDLIVADNLLRHLGYHAHAAANGEEAVSRLDYDLILMDCQMPEMDGFEATRAIRLREREPGQRRIPIVALTAHALKGDEERCLESGMDDFITKPLRLDALAEKLERWLKAS